jgi:hypothetical protein
MATRKSSRRRPTQRELQAAHEENSHLRFQVGMLSLENDRYRKSPAFKVKTERLGNKQDNTLGQLDTITRRKRIG